MTRPRGSWKDGDAARSRTSEADDDAAEGVIQLESSVEIVVDDAEMDEGRWVGERQHKGARTARVPPWRV